MLRWLSLAAFLLGLGIVLGAFGAHSLEGKLSPYQQEVYQKATFYHLLHALGLIFVPLLFHTGLASRKLCQIVCVLLLSGIIIFSGSLYALAITGIRNFGAITPIGGTCFILGWFCLSWGLWRGNRAASV